MDLFLIFPYILGGAGSEDSHDAGPGAILLPAGPAATASSQPDGRSQRAAGAAPG